MNASSTSAKAAGSKSMSAMVLATSSRVIRNHSYRAADLGQSSRPSRMEPSGQMQSRMFAISSAQPQLPQVAGDLPSPSTGSIKLILQPKTLITGPSQQLWRIGLRRTVIFLPMHSILDYPVISFLGHPHTEISKLAEQ